jgi:hypothetical protein
MTFVTRWLPVRHSILNFIYTFKPKSDIIAGIRRKRVRRISEVGVAGNSIF